MKSETTIKAAMKCFVCLACLILCGCYEEQSYHINKRRCSVSLEGLLDASSRSGEINETEKQQEIQRYARVVYDALDDVRRHSTEGMKVHVSRGELVIGMNQKEVLAALHTANYRGGVPIPSKTFCSKYGKHETWIVGKPGGAKYACCSLPEYALDFNCFILTGIHEPLDALVKMASEINTPDSHDHYYQAAYDAMGRMCYGLHAFEDEHPYATAPWQLDTGRRSISSPSVQTAL